MASCKIKPGIFVIWMSIFCLCIDRCCAILCPTGMTGLDHCDCGWDSNINQIDDINCTNQQHTTHDSLLQLKVNTPHITKLTYTGNNIKELGKNIFGECSTTSDSDQLKYLKFIDLSRNQIEIIHGQSFHCVPNVETLILDYNEWNVDEGKARVFSSMSMLKTLHLHNAFGHTFRDNTINLQTVFEGSSMRSLGELHLEENSIQFMARGTFCSLPNLVELHLSKNNLTKVNLDCLDKLQRLFLMHNDFESLVEEDISSLEGMHDLEVVHLGFNPFQCNDCSKRTAELRDWLNTHTYIMETENLKCANEELKEKVIKDLTDEELKDTCTGPLLWTKKRSNARQITTGVILSIIAILAVIFIYVNRRSIKKATSKWIQPIRSSNFMKRMHFGYANMNNDQNSMFSNMENDDEATFARMSTDDAARYASVGDVGDTVDYPEISNDDATTYPNMEADDTAPVVT